MAFIRKVGLRFSLAFALALQVLQFFHGYSWWVLFSSLGLWTLTVPVTTTYGGAAMVMWDDCRGYRYTSDWARVFTAAFLAFFFTLSAVVLCAVVVVALGTVGIIFK